MEKEEFLDDYMDEANDMLDNMNESMLDFEESGDEEALNELFRSAHTLKGSSRTMEFEKIAELSHSMEDVFNALQEGDIEPDDELFDLLFNSIDTLEEMVEYAGENVEEPDRDISDLLENLEHAQKGEELEEMSSDSVAESPEEFEEIQRVQVDIERLDKIMNSLGELMIVEKRLRKLLTPFESDDVESAMNTLKRLGEDIQHEASQARMIPASQVFDRFPRAVRDIASDMDKQVNFEIEGEDLRLDRTILDEIGEPILHMIRNAVDHGIESPEEREDKGKDPEGSIKLSAERKGNEVIIAVEDDGRGINPRDVRDKAVEKGVIDEEEKKELSREETLDLLFQPSFSTTDEVTQVSGRGVGLNVVKKTAEKLQGTYDIETELDHGTTIKMQVPLSLAIVRCFLVQVGNQRFGIPINNIIKAVSLGKEDIKSLEEEEVFVFQEEEIPLIMLEDRFDVADAGRDRDQINAVVVQKGNERAGLVVDRITNVQDLVIKDLDILEPKGVAGASILADGNPTIIVEISSLLGD
ncbi:MAG: chemotaxis protein CheA [Candidatus Nanohaloarchaea archaeon]